MRISDWSSDVCSSDLISGTVPLRDLAEKTSGGKMARDMFRAAGRQSLPWRIGQDLKTLPIIQERLVIGNARWDWFRGAGTRHRGLPLLLLGQFGLFGLLGLLDALGCGLFGSLRREPKGVVWVTKAIVQL